MFKFMKAVFTWWNGSTIGTKFFTWRKGRFIGSDEFGNRYYEGPLHKDGYPQRWVIYKDYSEASLIPPGWHGWIHHRVDIPPCEETYIAKKWEKTHQPNLTATDAAYYPAGSSKGRGQRPKVTGDYEAWCPNE